MRSYLRLLRDYPAYTRVWLAQVVSLTGDWFNTIALQTLVVAYAPENAGLAVSALLLSRFVPPMLISPFAGVLADRFDRKQLMLWSNLLRGVVVIGYLFATQSRDLLWLVYALNIVQFGLSSFFEPAQSALIPRLVQREDLIRANTLVNITWSVMLAVGAVLGGLVGAVFGANTALILDALTFFAAAAIIFPVKVPFAPPEAPSAERKPPVTLRTGLQYARTRPAVLSAMLIKFGISLGNVDTLITIYATQLFVLGSGGQLSLGIMYSVFGFGALLSPLIANRFQDGSLRRLRVSVTIGFVLIVGGWLLLGAAGSLIGVCVALFLRATGGSLNWTYSTIILQKTAQDSYLGRVFSLEYSGFYLATVISTLAHGWLIDTFGRDNLHAIAFGTALVALIPLSLWAYAVRRLDRREVALAA